MVVVLENTSGNGPYYYLKVGTVYSIGRKNADIELKNDESISRQHASISIQIANNNSEILATVTDCKSKYGTSVNATKMKPNATTNLKANDVVKFGAFQSIYRVRPLKFVTTGSALSNNVKAEMKSLLPSFGGRILTNWSSECTHLTVEEVSLTLKVLQALLDGKPFVVPDYWHKVSKAISENHPLPNVANYKPPIAEVLFLESPSTQLEVDPKRETLFTGKTFVFSTELIKRRMEKLVHKTGGDCFSWEKNPMELSHLKLQSERYLFVVDDNEFVSASLSKIHRVWERELRCRVMRVQEIATAIFFCSCDKYCNPKFNMNVFDNVNGSEPMDVGSVLVEQTQSQDIPRAPKTEAIVSGTFEDNVFAQPTASTPKTHEFKLPRPSKATKQTTLNFWKRPPEPSPENSTKRIRLEENKTSDTEQVSATPSTSRELFFTPIPATMATANPEVPRSSAKRKAETALNPCSSAKRNNTAPNPFANMRHEVHVTGTNPFSRESLQAERESKVREQPARIVQEVTPQSGALSLVSDVKITDSLRGKPIGQEQQVRPAVLEVSEECKQLYERFKNLVVLEKAPAIRRQDRSQKNNSGVESKSVNSGGSKNFKKFRKVLPLHPHNRSLATTSQVVCNSRNSTIETSRPHIDVTGDISDDEDVQMSRPVPSKRPQVKVPERRFVIDF